MLSAISTARKLLKPMLPPWAHKALRLAWYNLVLPPARLISTLKEMTGRDYSLAPPGPILAQYGISSPEAYSRIGEKKLAMIEYHVGRLPLTAKILDFGCGAAGTLSAFQRRYPHSQCYGCDLKADVIGWVEKHRPELTVVRNSSLPPLPCGFDGFDLVYAISVWTHMDEKACAQWLAHMHERLKPGGILYFTVAEPSIAARWHGFDPVSLSQRVRDKGGCLYDPGTDMTYIQREWVEREIAGRFRLSYFGPAHNHSQWAVVLIFTGSP